MANVAAAVSAHRNKDAGTFSRRKEVRNKSTKTGANERETTTMQNCAALDAADRELPVESVVPVVLVAV
jgi:hypothetical protein|tara:strand:+ start:1021 stop:1227 length:207 start_codon:yes stop_codon:yes gene_type:complete